MTITTPNSKTFRLERSGLNIAELHFPSIWTHKAEARLASGMLEIRKEGRWETKYSYWLNGKPRGSVQLKSLKNCVHLEIDWLGDGYPTTYKFKSTSVWASKFALMNAEEEQILTIRPRWSWRKFRHRYELEWQQEVEGDEATELVIYALHLTRIKLQQQAAAAG